MIRFPDVIQAKKEFLEEAIVFFTKFSSILIENLKRSKRMDLKVSNCRLIPTQNCSDPNGQLFVMESLKTVPFDIKRAFFIKDVTHEIVRGKHSNIKTKMQAICLTGSCKFHLDDGKKQEVVTLNTPEISLYIGNGVWREMFDFSKDCVLMVLASEFYDASEYIRNYEDFLKTVKK